MKRARRQPAPKPVTRPATAPSLIMTMAGYLCAHWHALDTIHLAHATAPQGSIPGHDRERLEWDHRCDEVNRRIKAIEGTIAALVADTAKEAMVQIYLAYGLIDALQDEATDPDLDRADMKKIHFLLRSALRVLGREHGVTVKGLGLSAYAQDDRVSLTELTEHIEPEPARGTGT